MKGAMYVLNLENVLEVLLRHDGRLQPSADELRIPVHSLSTYIAQHAECQAITRSRKDKILDHAQDVILENIGRDSLLPTNEKVKLAQWAVINGDANNWSPKQTVAVNNERAYNDMSIEELEAYMAKQGYVKAHEPS